MREHQAMLDAIRDGLINKAVAQVPDDPIERTQHLKSFGYFADAAVVGVCALPSQAILKHPHINPDIANLNHKLQTGQTKTLAAGIDMVMADLRDSIEADPTSIEHHTHALVLLYENPRDPKTDETGTGWIKDAQATAPDFWRQKRQVFLQITCVCLAMTHAAIRLQVPM